MVVGGENGRRAPVSVRSAAEHRDRRAEHLAKPCAARGFRIQDKRKAAQKRLCARKKGMSRTLSRIRADGARPSAIGLTSCGETG